MPVDAAAEVVGATSSEVFLVCTAVRYIRDDVWRSSAWFTLACTRRRTRCDAKTKDLLRISAEWDRGWSCPAPCGRDIRCYPAACISAHHYHHRSTGRPQDRLSRDAV